MALTTLIGNFVRDEGAATAIEYALVAAGIAVVITATVYSLGTPALNPFTQVNDKFDQLNGG